MRHSGSINGAWWWIQRWQRNVLFFSNNFQRMMCISTLRDIIYMSWFMNETDWKVIIFHPYPAIGGVWCGCESGALTGVRGRFKPISLRIWITPWHIFQMHLDCCSLAIAPIWSTFSRNMSNTISPIRNDSTITDSVLTINIITQYRSMKGYSLMGLYTVQDRMDLSNECSTWVGAPEWTSMS